MRMYPRYAVLMEAVIIKADGHRIPCYVTDLSMGGAALETAHGVATDLGRFTLIVTERNFELRVECDTRNVRELWRRQVIHAQFIGAEHHAPVEEVLHRVQGEASADVVPFPKGTAGHLNIIRRLFGQRGA